MKNTKATLRTLGNAWNHIGDAIDLLETIDPRTKEVENTIRTLEKTTNDICSEMEKVKQSLKEEKENEVEIERD